MEDLFTLIAFILLGIINISNGTTYQATNVVPSITAIPNGIPTSTTHIVITGNTHLVSLPANVFISHTNLVYADLSSNNISFVHPDAFKGTILKTLLLYDNWFTQVPAIDHIASSLTVLNLKWNVLETVPVNSLITYPNLLELDISLNKIEWTPAKLDGLLSVVTSLNKLDIGTTKGPPSGSPVDLSNYVFQNLTELRLSKVTNLPNIPYLAATVSHLNVWDLSMNALTNSHISSSNCNYTVGELILSHNSLTAMPDFISSNWKLRLNFLRLSHNAITYVDPLSFNGMSSLVTLDLSNNLISKFPNFTMTSTPLLEEIFLGDNLITNVPADALYNLTSLMFLWLDNNPIAVFEDLNAVMPSLNTTRLYLGLTGVNFVCNCSFIFIFQVSQSVHPNVTASLDTMPCSSPHEVAAIEKQNLTLLDICPNAMCDPVPTWIDVRTNNSNHALGATMQYYCREGYLFTTTSTDNELRTTRCNALTGVWEPSFDSCTEKANPEEDAKFKEAVDSDLAEVIGTFTLIFVCAEIGFLMLLDITHFQKCCKRCKPKKKPPSNPSEPETVLLNNKKGESSV